MKKIYTIALVAVCLLFVYSGRAQSIMVVDPGSGTLNAAIKANGGNKIYQLKAGEWYGLDAPIENVDYKLQIIGAEPAVTGGKPATVQTGSDVNGSPFDHMFDAKGDITLRNIYFVNADLNGVVANQFLVESKASTRITVDRCVLQPCAVATTISGTAGFIKTYFTNNQAIGFGHQISPNDGHFFAYGSNDATGLDTLYVENNTFVCMGMNMFSGNFAAQVNNYVNFNHNTFCMTKSQIDWADFKKEQYWTNNLMFDLQTQPYANNWQPMPGGDVARPKPNLIYADTIKGEVLPSVRPCFVEYNGHYRSPAFWTELKALNVFSASKKLAGMYLYPLVWSKDSVDCREAQMFNSTGFPKFKYGNTITDVDPQWTDKRIYDHEANFVLWTDPATKIHALGQPATDYPPATQWPQWWWIPNATIHPPLGDLSNNDVWPVFDGTYKNTKNLHGSIEVNVPLGDLNWFPAAKTVWKANKAKIDAHIKAGNTAQIDIGYIPTSVQNTKADGFSMFPNPAHNVLNISGVRNAEITLMTIDGRMIRTVKNIAQVNISDLSNGTYLVKVKDGANTSIQKLFIAR